MEHYNSDCSTELCCATKIDLNGPFIKIFTVIAGYRRSFTKGINTEEMGGGGVSEYPSPPIQPYFVKI